MGNVIPNVGMEMVSPRRCALTDVLLLKDLVSVALSSATKSPFFYGKNFTYFTISFLLQPHSFLSALLQSY